MEYIIDGKVYRMAAGLNEFQKSLYRHLIDWKAQNITDEPGLYKGHPYDYMFPQEYLERDIPPFIYSGIHSVIRSMQEGPFRYKVHKMACHMASSQSACVNLFVPILMDSNADKVIGSIPDCPAGFARIDRERLFNGFCLEYWGQDIAGGKGLLRDHSSGAGTDSDIAIAYIDKNGKHCLWIIEHKLAEKEFTCCGGYYSERNREKWHCTKESMQEIQDAPHKCHYHRIGYRYWDIMQAKGCLFSSSAHECPFKDGMNQLWRNQLLAFALEDTGRYAHVSFSVVHHRDNCSLDSTMEQYRRLTGTAIPFTSFTNADVVSQAQRHAPALSQWCRWYRELYMIE